MNEQIQKAAFELAAREAASIEAFLRGQNANPGEWALEITLGTLPHDGGVGSPGISLTTKTYRLVPKEAPRA